MSNNTEQVHLQLGRVLNAFDTFNWACSKTKPAATALSEAKKDVSSMGFFEDCGEFYRERHVEKEEALSNAVYYQQALEKHFKKLRHEFLELFPAEKWVFDKYPDIFKR